MYTHPSSYLIEVDLYLFIYLNIFKQDIKHNSAKL